MAGRERRRPSVGLRRRGRVTRSRCSAGSRRDRSRGSGTRHPAALGWISPVHLTIYGLLGHQPDRPARAEERGIRQSWMMSLVEALTNAVMGHGVGVATQLVVFPILGLPASIGQNLKLALMFTGVSIAPELRDHPALLPTRAASPGCAARGHDALKRRAIKRFPDHVITERGKRGDRASRPTAAPSTTAPSAARRHRSIFEGIAFDIAMGNHDPEVFEAAARAVGFRGFGFYPRSGFIHVDLGPRHAAKASGSRSARPPSRRRISRRCARCWQKAARSRAPPPASMWQTRCSRRRTGRCCPLVPHLDTLRCAFIAVALGGIAVAIGARLDHWKRGGRR